MGSGQAVTAREVKGGLLMVDLPTFILVSFIGVCGWVGFIVLACALRPPRNTEHE